MNKKELLHELLKNFPEFEKDKQSLEKTLDFMLKNNPDIKIDEWFKKSLKEKIETTARLKKEKKSNSVWFLVPIFGFIFSLCWIFYVFFGVNFFHNWSVENIQKYDTFKNYDSEEKYEVKESKDINPQIEKSDATIKTNTQPEKSPQKTKTSATNESIKKDVESSSKTTPHLENSTLQADTFKHVGKQQQTPRILDDTNLEKQWKVREETWENKLSPLEDNQILDFVEGIEWSSTLKKDTDKKQQDFAPATMKVLEAETLIFSDFCKTSSGTLIEEKWYQICKIWKKACVKETYKNWDCEWKQVEE